VRLWVLIAAFIWLRVVSWKKTDVSEVRTASVIKAIALMYPIRQSTSNILLVTLSEENLVTGILTAVFPSQLSQDLGTELETRGGEM
jgi:hypothetical protein